MKLTSIFFLLILFFNLKGLGQPSPFRGTILFNFSEKEYGELLTKEDLKRMNIQLLSYNKNSEFSYDKTQKAFSFTTSGFANKVLAIVYKADTTFINFPSLPFLDAVFIKAPIPLSGKSFSFSNKHTYDAMHSNRYFNKFNIFYLCQGCFISNDYLMPEDVKKHIEKDMLIYKIKLKE